MEKVTLSEKFALFSETWSPRIVGELNEDHIKLAKLKGKFVWHKHDDEDELFFVVRGSMTLHLRDRRIDLEEGEFFVVPRGVEHCPEAIDEAHVLLIEPKGTVNTGDAPGERTVTDLERI